MNPHDFQKQFFRRIGNFEVFKFIFDLLPDVGIVIKDCEGRIVLFNRYDQANRNDLDQKPALIGHIDYTRFPKDIAEKKQRSDRYVIEGGKPIINGIYSADHGYDRITIYSKAPILNDDGQVIGIIAIYRYLDSPQKIPDWHGHMSEVLTFIHTHYMKPISVQDLAQKMNVSVVHLERLFKKLFGDTPVEYIHRLRISASLRLLETTNTTISVIAQEIGYFDQSHFIRHFKRLRGCTPKQHRQHCNNAHHGDHE